MRFLLLIALVAARAQAEELKAVVESTVAPLVKDRKYATMVVGVLEKGSEQIFAFGEWDGKAPDRDSIYEIGSITKVFTGILLADRVKAGVVKLDDPVQKHLPDGWTMPRRDDRDITLLHLATHTSGLPRMPNGFLPVILANPQNPFSRFDESALKKGLGDTAVLYPIGARQQYSNLGVGLLGHVLSHASKADSYEAIVTDRVLKPLGLNDTTVATNDSHRKRVIPGHTAAGKPEPNWDFACLGACGAIRSTTADLLKFVKANADLSGSLKDVLLMAQQSWRDVRPGSEESGLCWVRYVGKKSDPVKIWHNGQTGGYHAFVGFIPGKGGVTVLCNVASMKVDDLGFAVLKHLAEAK